MKNKTGRTLWYFWQSMRNYNFLGGIMVLSIVVGTILDSILPIYFKNFFNVLTGGEEKSVIAKALISVLIVIAILKLAKWLVWRVAFFILNFYESRVMADLGEKCFSYIHKHSFSYFSNNFTGSVVKKVKSFVNAFEVLADQLFYEILPAAVTMTVVTIVLARINVFLGIGMLAWIILFLTINWAFTKYKLKFDVQRSEAETATSSFLADTVTNNTNIKLFNGLNSENSGYTSLMEKLHKLRRFTWDLSAKFYGLQSLLLVGLEIGIFYFAIGLWQKNILTNGDFVLIQSYILTVIFMVWDFGKVISRIYERLAEAEEMTIIFDTPHEIIDIEGAKKLKITNGEIVFDKVGFAYENGERVIDNFSLKIKSGETVALVGTSGAGKTTLVKLLLRLFNVNEGRILIDGQNIAEITQESLRKAVSLVPQDPILFHRSLLENIRYGRINATDKEVIAASKLAHCDEFIDKLPLKYETFVGERGIKLSGGERQRVAIARAILRNAPILVLDEATSSLDSESEKYIQESLDELMKDKTVIVIAHRLSTIKKVDRIVVIDNKKIVEDGDHSSLFKKKNGIYSKLWDIQVGGFIK